MIERRREDLTQDERVAQNLRVIKHEIETPMRGHDGDSECCRRAALAPDARSEETEK